LHCVHITLQILVVGFDFGDFRITTNVLFICSTPSFAKLELLSEVAVLNLEVVCGMITTTTGLDPATELLGLVSNFLLREDCKVISIDRGDLLV